MDGGFTSKGAAYKSMLHFVNKPITYDAVYGETLDIAGILHGLIIYVDCINSNLYCINSSVLLMGHINSESSLRSYLYFSFTFALTLPIK